jgi:lipocalin-like protein
MADSHTELLGIWKLRACDMEYQESGAREPYFSAAPPSGYLILTPEGRMMALIMAGDREPGQTDEQQAALFRTMVAYAGRYHLEDDQFITTVDVS